MKKIKLLTFLTALAASSAAQASVPVQIVWQTSLKEGLALAQRLNRPALVNVYADWCGYCTKLRREVYPTEEVRRAGARFVFIDINGEHHPELLNKYRIRGFPVILFMDKNGYLLDRLDGFVRSPAMARKMRDVERRAGMSDELKEDARKNPDRLLANFKLGLYYTETGNLTMAREHYLRAWRAKQIDAPEHKRDALYNAAVSSMQIDDHLMALKCWDDYVDMYSTTADADFIYARYYRGMSLKRLGRKDRARADLRYAVQNLPSAQDREQALQALESLK